MPPLPIDLHVIAIVASEADALRLFRATAGIPHVSVAVILRNKQVEPGILTASAHRLLRVARPTNVLFGVNGIHVSGADLVHRPFAALTNTVDRPPGVSIGTSVHSTTELDLALTGVVDYILCGPVLPTPSKPGHPGIGTARLASIVRRSTVPVFAIGGMSVDASAVAIESGARGVAGISFCEGSESEIANRFAAIHDRFAIVGSLSGEAGAAV